MAKNNYNDTIREEDFEDIDSQEETKTTQNRRSRRKKGHAAGAFLLALTIAGGAAAGIGASYAIGNVVDYNRAAKLTGAYQAESYCIVPERIFTSQNHDFVYTSGKHLTQAAEKQDIDVLKIGDTFITKDGAPVARVILEIETVETADIIKCEVDGQEFYIEPDGYTWNNETNRCERTTTEIIERYVYANSDHNYSTIRVPGSRVVSVIEYEEYPSLSYEEATAMKLIADVNDSNVHQSADVITEASLKLVPNNQK